MYFQRGMPPSQGTPPSMREPSTKIGLAGDDRAIICGTRHGIVLVVGGSIDHDVGPPLRSALDVAGFLVARIAPVLPGG